MTDGPLQPYLNKWEEAYVDGTDKTPERLEAPPALWPALATEIAFRRGTIRWRKASRDERAALTPQLLAPDNPEVHERLAKKIAPASQMPDIPGYELLGELGRGGAGVVYRARQVGLDRLVAVKVLLAGAHAGKEAVARFRDEAAAVARLQNPNVVQIFEIGEFEERPFLSLEFCPDGTLADRLAGKPQLPRPAAADIAVLAGAIAAAHDAGILHRDLKPANVLLSGTAVKVCDFGLAKPLDETNRMTATGHAVGTPSYMAPETAAGQPPTPAVDIYGLGAILYECLTGRPPIVEASADPIAVRRLNPSVPVDLETVCHKCLEREPSHRYRSVRDLADDLARFLAGQPVAARPVGPVGRVWKLARRKPAVAVLVVTAAALVAAIAAIPSVYFAVEQRRLTALAAAADERATANDEAARRERALGESATSERDRAQVATLQARDALDVVISPEMVERLGAQEDLTAEQRRLYERVLTAYQKLAADSAMDDFGRLSKASAAARVAYLLEALGEPGVEPKYRAAIAGFARLAAERPNNLTARDELARAQNNLGVLLRKLGRPAEAEAAHRAALGERVNLMRDAPSNRQYRADAARSHSNLGVLARRVRNFPAALAAHSAALTIRRRLVADAPADRAYRRELAFTLNNRGGVLSDMGRTAEAVTDFREALALRERLEADDPTAAAGRYELAGGCQNLAVVLAAGAPNEAEPLFRRALDLHSQLAAGYQGVPTYRHALAVSHAKYGQYLSRRVGRGQQAEDELKTANDSLQRLVAAFPDVEAYRRDWGVTLLDFADLLVDREKLDLAEQLYRAAAELYGPAAADENRRNLGRTHNSLGILLKNQKRSAEAETAFRAALDVKTGFAAAAVNDHELWCDVARTHFNLGNLFGDGKRSSEAESAFRAALQIFARSAASRKQASQTRLSLAELLARRGVAEEAVALAEIVVAEPNSESAWLYRCGKIDALASAVPGVAQADAYAARAVALLRRSVGAGFRNIDRLTINPDFQALRHRADFAELLWDIADGRPAK